MSTVSVCLDCLVGSPSIAPESTRSVCDPRAEKLPHYSKGRAFCSASRTRSVSTSPIKSVSTRLNSRSGPRDFRRVQMLRSLASRLPIRGFLFSGLRATGCDGSASRREFRFFSLYRSDAGRIIFVPKLPVEGVRLGHWLAVDQTSDLPAVPGPPPHTHTKTYSVVY